MEKETVRIENMFNWYTKLKQQNFSYVVIEAEKNNSEILLSSYGCKNAQEANKFASKLASEYRQPLDSEDSFGYATHPFFSVPQLLLKKEKKIIAYMKITEYLAYTLSLNIIMKEC